MAPQSEQCLAENNLWAMQSYALNSIFTHRSCRYALEGVVPGFANEAVVSSLINNNIIMFSERNSEGLSDPGSGFFYVPQDDYDTWPGEAALVEGSVGSVARPRRAIPAREPATIENGLTAIGKRCISQRARAKRSCCTDRGRSPASSIAAAYPTDRSRPGDSSNKAGRR